MIIIYFVYLKEKLEVWLTSLKYALEKDIKKNPSKFTLNSCKVFLIFEVIILYK
jgi:hypothetical protein